MDKGEPWTDDKFPPEMKSLCKNPSDEDTERFSAYEWKRASDIYQEVSIFSDGISPGDVSQGELGDCYFLAVCSSMAEDPTRVQQRFITTKPNAAGAYLVDFYVNGVETPVLIDDWLPTKFEKPAFAHSKTGELWVSLLEKAWAKLHGSF